MKRLAKAVDAAGATVAMLLAEHAQPALEAAAFQLAELHSLAHCTRWLAPLGIEVCSSAWSRLWWYQSS